MTTLNLSNLPLLASPAVQPRWIIGARVLGLTGFVICIAAGHVAVGFGAVFATDVIIAGRSIVRWWTSEPSADEGRGTGTTSGTPG